MSAALSTVFYWLVVIFWVLVANAVLIEVAEWVQRKWVAAADRRFLKRHARVFGPKGGI